MAFIPVVPPVHAFGSPAAIELSQKLAHAIQEYRQTHPGVSADDVRDALRIVAQSETGASRRRLIVMGAVTAMLLGLGLVFAVMSSVGRGRASVGFALPMVVVAVVVLALLFVVVVRRQ